MTQHKDRLDIITRQVLEKMSSEIPQPAICPDDETLGAYLEGRLSEKERDRTEKHLATCRKCTEDIVAISEIESFPPHYEETYASPNMIKMAKRLIKPAETEGILKRFSSWFTAFKPMPMMATAAVILFISVTVFYQTQTSQVSSLKTSGSINLSLIGRTPSEITIRGKAPHYKEIEIKEGGILRSGDFFKIRFKLEKSAYIYILSLDSQGNLRKLYPDRDGKAITEFKAHEAYSIPEDDRWFRLDDNTGRETFYIVASPKTIEAIEKRIIMAKKPNSDEIGRMFSSAQIKSITIKHE